MPLVTPTGGESRLDLSSYAGTFNTARLAWLVPEAKRFNRGGAGLWG